MYGKDVCEVFKKILPGHVAMLDEQTTLQYEIRSSCAKIQDTTIEQLRMCKKPVSYTRHAWATQLSAPYTNAMNNVIRHVIEGM